MKQQLQLLSETPTIEYVFSTSNESINSSMRLCWYFVFAKRSECSHVSAVSYYTSCLIVHMPRRKRWRISKLWLVLVRSGNIVWHSNQYLIEDITEAKLISRTNENVCLKVRFRRGTWNDHTHCWSTLVNIFACENMRGLDICSCT